MVPFLRCRPVVGTLLMAEILEDLAVQQNLGARGSTVTGGGAVAVGSQGKCN